MEFKIVCMGDSLTEGYGLKEHESWTYLLEEDMQIECINSGISGDTTAGMLARFKSMVIDHNPSHVIIMGGTNDLFLNVAEPQILSNVIAMTKFAKIHGIQSIIGLPTSVLEVEGTSGKLLFISQKQCSERIEKYREKLKYLAHDKGLEWIDFDVDIQAAHYLEDGLHPNAKGHQIMMENAKRMLNRILNQQPVE